MRRSVEVLAVVLAFAAVWGSVSRCVSAAPEEPQKQGLTNPFFAMDTGISDEKHVSARSQAEMVKELGFAGIGCDIKAMPDMLAAVEECGLKLFAVYVGANVDPSKPKYDPNPRDVIKSLKGRDTFVWLFVTGGKPSATDLDERAVEIVREVADMAAESGLRVALYPHTGFYMARVEDAVRLCKKAERKNVGVTFNLCHWLRLDREENMKALLKQAMPHLWVVTINGADSGGQDWNTLIQTLDRGTFDIYGFLKTLKELGYKGPIGLQHYGIKGDAHENLRRSIAAWRQLSARLAAESK